MKLSDSCPNHDSRFRRFYDKGRAVDGRRAYRCRVCGATWTEGLQGRKRRWSPQRDGNQFHDTGATNQRKLKARIREAIASIKPGPKPSRAERKERMRGVAALEMIAHRAKETNYYEEA